MNPPEHSRRFDSIIQESIRRVNGRIIAGWCAVQLGLVLSPAFAQVPDTAAPAASLPPLAAPTTQTPAAPAATPADNSSKFLGKDLPFYDPKSEFFTWDGKSWNINNNRAFQARFEKFLSAPEETDLESREYQRLITEILARTAQAAATKENVDYAFRLLIQASKYDTDSRLSDSLADAIYTVWMAKREQKRLESANRALQYEIVQLEAQSRLNAKASQHSASVSRKMAGRRNEGGQPGGGPPVEAREQAAEAREAVTEAADWKTRRLAELIGYQTTNKLKREISEVQAKIEYQALCAQFLVQRRFQHVLMGTRFYRALFSDGDAKLQLSKEVNDQFVKNVGFSPTISTIDSMANEALRDVRESVRTFEFLAQKNELESATKRLGEAFIVGEFVPEIRALPRSKKRLALEFTQKANQLQSAMEVKDFTKAETLIKELATTAKDFDGTQASAAIESARRGAKMHLLTARNAAQANDTKTLKESLAEATKLWPLNPALAEFSDKIFDHGDLQLRALNEFDTLLSQKNYRQIFDDQARFITAISQSPERKPKLQEVLQKIQTIEASILRAQEMRRQNNFAGAWESVEKQAAEFPDDSKLNQLRAELTSLAADFVRNIRTAEDLEKKEQVGSSLAWYLKAQKVYPASDFATSGVTRLKKKILPDG